MLSLSLLVGLYINILSVQREIIRRRHLNITCAVQPSRWLWQAPAHFPSLALRWNSFTDILSQLVWMATARTSQLSSADGLATLQCKLESLWSPGHPKYALALSLEFLQLEACQISLHTVLAPSWLSSWVTSMHSSCSLNLTTVAHSISEIPQKHKKHKIPDWYECAGWYFYRSANLRSARHPFLSSTPGRKGKLPSEVLLSFSACPTQDRGRKYV